MAALAILLFTIIVCAAGIGLVVYYHQREKRQARQAEDLRCRSLLSQALKKRGIKGFDFGSFVRENEIPVNIAERVADEAYGKLWRRIVDDGEITDQDRQQEEALRKALAITPERASSIAQKAKEDRYRAATTAVLADGIITESESLELQKLRRNLSLGSSQALHVTGDMARDHYLALFRQIASDGRITPDELKELERCQAALGLSLDQANGILHDDALTLYRQWFTNIIQDGEVTDEEEKSLQWLVRRFGLKFADVQYYQIELDAVKRLSAYRKGNLPSIHTSKLLESGEFCHWHGTCCYRWETARNTKDADGELLVTSNQVVFSSPTKSFGFSPAKILDVRLYSNAVEISNSINRGAGVYFVEDPRVVEAILVGLAKKHKYCAEVFSSDQTRHIPDSVRREVWIRDGGKCVRCGAQDYLEFDHIIPHARGGANTVKNVQLLCRRCNNLKRDRI